MISRLAYRRLGLTLLPSLWMGQRVQGMSMIKFRQVPIRQLGSFATLKQNVNNDQDENNIMNEDNMKSWKVDYSTVIPQYPFHHIPVAIVRNPSLFQIDQSLKNDLIAFKAISLRNQDISLASNLILTPKQRINLEKQEDERKGQRIFDFYYESKIDGFIEIINKGTASFEQRLNAIIILNYISKYFMLEGDHQSFNETTIIKQDDSGIILSYYIRMATKFDQDYTHLLPILIQKLQNNDSKHKLIIARTILSTVKYQQYYSEKVISLAIQIYIQRLAQLHNYQIIYSLRVLYNYQSESARKYAEKLIEHIKMKNIEEGNVDFHVPLILKAIKYCNKHRLSCDQLVQYVMNNMKRFKVIFEEKNMSKGLLFSLMFQKASIRHNSEQIVSFLKEFFFDTLKELSVSEEIEEGDLIRVSKLLIKYFDKLSEAEKEHVREEYLRYIIPQFNQSNQVLLYSLLVVLRSPRVKPQQPQKLAKFTREAQMIKKMAIQYLTNCSQKSSSGLVISKHVNSAIEIFYQIDRHKLGIHKSQLPSLIGYNFNQKQTLAPEVVGYFFSYLNHCEEKPQDIKRVIDQIEPLLEGYLRQRKIYSLITVYTIINVCSKIDYEHQFFYKHLENFISNFLARNPNFFIQDKDINFLNNKLVKRGYGSKNLQHFVEEVLDNSKNWKRCRQIYVERQKAFKQKRQNLRRNKK